MSLGNTSAGSASSLPDLKNEIRNKALAGIKKYLKNESGEEA